jgi:hypothetical protein
LRHGDWSHLSSNGPATRFVCDRSVIATDYGWDPDRAGLG